MKVEPAVDFERESSVCWLEDEGEVLPCMYSLLQVCKFAAATRFIKSIDVLDGILPIFSRSSSHGSSHHYSSIAIDESFEENRTRKIPCICTNVYRALISHSLAMLLPNSLDKSNLHLTLTSQRFKAWNHSLQSVLESLNTMLHLSYGIHKPKSELG